MQRLALPSALALAAAILCAPALAANPGPFGTGLDASGAPLAQNAVDPHYEIVGSAFFGPAAYAKLSGAPIDNGAWINNSAASTWLVPDPDFFFLDQAGVTDTITYRTTFDLSAFSAPGWRIDGRWAADDSGLTIRLNGVVVPGTAVAQADQWANFSITSGILPGLNTLEFTTFSTVSPSGLRVEMTTTAVPEPGAWALMAAGLGLVALRRRGGAQ
jgi:hypothetical protein